MKKLALAQVLVCGLCLGGFTQCACAVEGIPLTPEHCTQLAKLRDGAVFRESDTATRVINASREARQDLQKMIDSSKIEAHKYGAIAATKQFLLLTQVSTSSLQALLGMLGMPSSTQFTQAFANSLALELAHTTTIYAQRAVDSTAAFEAVQTDASKLEVAAAFGALLPVVGDTISALKSLADLIQSGQEINLDQRAFGTRIQRFEKDLQAAEKRLAKGQFRAHFSKAFKDEVDRRCGRIKTVSKTVLVAPDPVLKDFFRAAPAVAPPSARSSGPADCGLLDDGRASMDLSMREPDRFDALLEACRARRGP